MNLIKLTLSCDSNCMDESVIINTDMITYMIPRFGCGTSIYLVGKKHPLFVDEEYSDIVEVLEKIGRV